MLEKCFKRLWEVKQNYINKNGTFFLYKIFHAILGKNVKRCDLLLMEICEINAFTGHGNFLWGFFGNWNMNTTPGRLL